MPESSGVRHRNSTQKQEGSGDRTHRGVAPAKSPSTPSLDRLKLLATVRPNHGRAQQLSGRAVRRAPPAAGARERLVPALARRAGFYFIQMPPWEVYEDSCGTRMATTATEPGSRPCLHYLFQQQRWTKVSTVREIIYSRGRKFIQLFPLADWAWVSVGERKSRLSPRTGRCLATCKRNCQRRRRNMRSRQVLQLLRDY